MTDFRSYTAEERASFVAPACEMCGQHRHVRWVPVEDAADPPRWTPRDAGCSNEACTGFRV